MNNLYMVGLARSGKDTVASIVARELGMETYALADPIKDIMCDLFLWDEKHRDGSYKEIPMVYMITPDSLNKAAITYRKYKLHEHEEFHDCWDKVVKLFGIHIDEELGVAKTIISPRQAFQLFGTDWGRSVSPTMWIDIIPTENTIITDVRFDNEEELIRERTNAKGIYVTRPTLGKIKDSVHESEAGLTNMKAEYSIVNNSSLDKLLKKAELLAYDMK